MPIDKRDQIKLKIAEVKSDDILFPMTWVEVAAYASDAKWEITALDGHETLVTPAVKRAATARINEILRLTSWEASHEDAVEAIVKCLTLAHDLINIDTVNN